MEIKKSFWIITAAIFLGIIYYLYQNDYMFGRSINTNFAISRQNDKSDKRNCVTQEVEGVMDQEFMIGKKFQNFCMSGEWGTFNADGSISVEWGLDFAGENDTRPSKATGSWKLDGRKLVLIGTSISDAIYEDFRFYMFKNSIFAVPKNSYCGMFIGPDLNKIENFFDQKFEPESCK